jgi:hypothetical protein
MYVRNVKQFLRGVEASFDERRFGFTGILDLLRACQREGIFRLERDRQGVLRVFPGPLLQRPGGEPQAEAAAAETGPAVVPEIVSEPEPPPVVVEAEVVAESVAVAAPEPEVLPAEEPEMAALPEETPGEGAPRPRHRRAAPGARKTPAATHRKPRTTTRAPRARKRTTE